MYSNFLIIFAGISGVHVIPMIITCTLQGMLCDMGIPRIFYGGKICSVAIGLVFKIIQQYTFNILWFSSDYSTFTSCYYCSQSSHQTENFPTTALRKSVDLTTSLKVCITFY